MAANTAFQMQEARGWRAGFGNLLRKEARDWWGTRRWLVQALVYLVILNGIMAGALMSMRKELAESGQLPTLPGTIERQPLAIEGVVIFFIMAGLAPVIGTIILAQDEIVGEKQSGTAQWILSKPASRSAFILSKLVANAFGVLVLMVLVQGAVAYLLVYKVAGTLLPPAGFLGGLGAVFLNLAFYLTLALMLGTWFNSRGPVIGIPIALLLGYQFPLGIAPWLANIMPWGLVIPLSETMPSAPSTALALVAGEPVPSWTPAIATALWCVLFTAVALWRFNREEF